MRTPEIELVAGATNFIRGRQLYESQEKNYPTDATLLVTLRDANGDPVVGAVDLVLEHVDGTTGRSTAYLVLLPASLPLADGDTGTGVINATDTNGHGRPFNFTYTVVAG